METHTASRWADKARLDSAVLERADHLEKAGAESWTYAEVRAYPATLVRLIVQGRVEVVRPGKRGGDPALYRLTRAVEAQRAP